MKVIAINGSPKKNGNTFTALNIVADKLRESGIEVEIIQVGSMKMGGCIACNACIKSKNGCCPAYDDELGDIVQKVKDADGILLGSPVYYSGVAGGMKSFLDRFFMVCGVNGNPLRHKVGAAIATVRRSGGIPSVDELYKYLQYSEMVLPTSNYWTVIHGNRPGEVLKDAEGIQIMQILGENMAWMIRVLDASNIEKPEKAKKVWTDFVEKY